MAEAVSEQNDLQEYLVELCEEYCDLLPNEIPVIHRAPEAMDFLRNYVSPNIPFIIKNGIDHWTARTEWDKDYLRSQIGDKKCTVAVTPNGYADAVVDNMFMLPEERTLSFSAFLDEMENPHHSQVFYLQKQNNCLLDEFSPLVHDVDYHIPWATEAMVHKDHYENIYCVIKGVKEFILYPPVASAWMPYETFKKGVYYFEDGGFKVMDMDEEVKWIEMDPFTVDWKKYPMSLKTKKYCFNLHEGDVLYLPALWFHHVRQSHACIAVNYWYEMNFDLKYPYFYFLERLGKMASSKK